jgi:hypothetical protein
MNPLHNSKDEQNIVVQGNRRVKMNRTSLYKEIVE